MIPSPRPALLRAALVALAIPLLLAGAQAPAQRAAAQAPPVHETAADAAAMTDMMVGWYDLQLELMRETPGFSPPVAGRALAYVGVALWEAVAPAYPDARSLAGQLGGLEPLPAPDGPYHAAAAANHALAAAVRGLYPSAFAAHLAAVDELEAENARRFAREVDAATLERSRRFGEAVAAAVLAWAGTDGGHQGYLGGFSRFVPGDGPGAWVPTPRRNGPPFPPLHPGWAENRPLALGAGTDCMAPPPPVYSEEEGSAFYREALEVYDTVRSLTPERREIALFWADDPGQTSTPAGHWASILNEVLRSNPTPPDVAAEAWARLGIAVNDAFISCWNTKYRFDLLRPITYIQRVIDADWNRAGITDPVVTPPFPEYTSGHSVVSGAAAAVLTGVLGEAPFTDRFHERRGYEPRSYASFEEAAAEAAISRLYGGIHYRSAIENGLTQGRCVAERVNGLAFRR